VCWTATSDAASACRPVRQAGYHVHVHNGAVLTLGDIAGQRQHLAALVHRDVAEVPRRGVEPAGGLRPGGLPAGHDPGRRRTPGTAGDPQAQAAARQRAWALAGERAPGADGSLIPVDIDATIVIAHSEKEQAAATWKNTFGFHPPAAACTIRRA
jgi:hypothetical protein